MEAGGRRTAPSWKGAVFSPGKTKAKKPHPPPPFFPSTEIFSRPGKRSIRRRKKPKPSGVTRDDGLSGNPPHLEAFGRGWRKSPKRNDFYGFRRRPPGILGKLFQFTGDSGETVASGVASSAVPIEVGSGPCSASIIAPVLAGRGGGFVKNTFG